MKQYAKILFAIATAVICAIGFAADQPACKKSGKNCPMNNGGHAIAARTAIASEGAIIQRLTPFRGVMENHSR